MQPAQEVWKDATFSSLVLQDLQERAIYARMERPRVSIFADFQYHNGVVAKVIVLRLQHFQDVLIILIDRANLDLNPDICFSVFRVFQVFQAAHCSIDLLITLMGRRLRCGRCVPIYRYQRSRRSAAGEREVAPNQPNRAVTLTGTSQY